MRKTKINKLEIIIWPLFILGMLVKALYFQFSSGINDKPYFSRCNINMFFSLISSLTVLCSLILLIFNRKRLTILLAADFLLSLVLFSDTIYFRYFYNPVTASALSQIGLVGSVADSIKSLMREGDIIFAADIPVLIAVITLRGKNFTAEAVPLPVRLRIMMAVIILSAGIILSYITYGASSRGTFYYDNNYVVANLGIYYFHYYDTKRYAAENYFADRNLNKREKEMLESFFANGRNDGKSGEAAGRNLIIVQLEAIQSFIINAEYNGREVTPHLNRLINDSAYFENFYYQIGGGNTSDAEFLANTSLYPMKDASVYFRYPGNTYDSLPVLLKKSGYDSCVFHANSPSFWNRTEMYRAMGFDRFVSSKEYVLDDQLGWGLSDKSFLRQSLNKLDISKPFYGFFVTLTSHHPYNFFDGYEGGFDAGKFEGTMAGSYIKAAGYVDEAIGYFISDLKEKGLYDNSIIIIYGDHHSFPKEQSDVLTSLTGADFNEYNWIRLQKTPCFIRYPGMKKTGVVSTICGQIDLLPTVAGLMGFDAPHALGKDMFKTEYGYAVLRNGSVITEDFIYTASDGNVHDREGNVIASIDNLSGSSIYKSIKTYQQELEVSDLILVKNALKSIVAITDENKRMDK